MALLEAFILAGMAFFTVVAVVAATIYAIYSLIRGAYNLATGRRTVERPAIVEPRVIAHADNVVAFTSRKRVSEQPALAMPWQEGAGHAEALITSL